MLQLLKTIEGSLLNMEAQEIKELLGEFEDIFEEPKGLPPSRSHDNNIVLKSEAKPVCKTIQISLFSKRN